MNILVVGEANTWFDRHVTASLRELGHNVSVFHYGDAVGEHYSRETSFRRQQNNCSLLRQAREISEKRGLGLIFCYVYDDFLLPEIAAALRALGAPMVNYNVDMTNQWYRQIRTARYFTAMLCAQRIHMDDLARYGAPAYYFPMAARAPDFRDHEKIVIPAPVTFVGTPMPHRIAVLAHLVNAGIPLAVYGKLWLDGLAATPPRNLRKTLKDIYFYGLPRLRAEGIGALWAALDLRLHGGEDNTKPLEIDRSLIHEFLPDEQVSIFYRLSKVNSRLYPHDR